MVRVIIVAAYASVRAGLHVLLGGLDDLQIIGEASGSGDLERLLPDTKPDVVLADDLPEDRDCLLALLTEAAVGAVLLSETRDSAARLQWAALPGWALLRKEADGSEIVAAVRAVAAGLVALDRSFVAPLLSSPMPEQAGGEGSENLTAREREVLSLMALGLPNKQIAARLSISLHTAKFHVASVLAKMGASSRTEAVTLGAQRGAVSF